MHLMSHVGPGAYPLDNAAAADFELQRHAQRLGWSRQGLPTITGRTAFATHP